MCCAYFVRVRRRRNFLLFFVVVIGNSADKYRVLTMKASILSILRDTIPVWPRGNLGHAPFFCCLSKCRCLSVRLLWRTGVLLDNKLRDQAATALRHATLEDLEDSDFMTFSQQTMRLFINENEWFCALVRHPRFVYRSFLRSVSAASPLFLAILKWTHQECDRRTGGSTNRTRRRQLRRILGEKCIQKLVECPR